MRWPERLGLKQLKQEMRLFEVPSQTRVKITSKLIRWVEHGSEQVVGEMIVWEGITTGSYFHFKSQRRRLLVNHTIDIDEFGIWQADCECEVISQCVVDYDGPRP